ncbi:hypothetical protein U9M48_034939 [Paspalum notatum var. saurae]|uniref:Protein kinase domain-containing protein n=1 Tax=Paspalum notatum var. saurae TaxID=547442 RepID=A0AAQ3UA60_PASNO
METLGNKIKHRNLVPLLDYYKISEERLLMYEYMSNGSLEDDVRPPRPGPAAAVGAAEARGAARGLCSLHYNCILDVMSSNVLLDGDMEAHVADFGMARLISALDTHLSTTRRGWCSWSSRWSGRRPTDKEDFGDNNLVGWVKMKVRKGGGKEVVDPELVVTAVDGEEKGIARFLELALQCIDDFPPKRPNMLQVVTMLRELDDAPPSQEPAHAPIY